MPSPSAQKILPTRRTYNKLVANEMMEDFALRFTPKRARQWSLAWVASTALGIISFLVLEAIGGAITLNYGFVNSAWAILAVVVVIFVSGLPISYYAARYGVDIDLLTRGAGFGYIGSTISSLIYASFTFIFFALEAAIMSMALQLLFDLPLAIGYVVSALVVLPLVINGISHISRFQVWTQPIWLILQLVPLFYVFNHQDSQLSEWLAFTGDAGAAGSEFNLILFGVASAVLLSLVAQIGEQVDILRFLPQKPQKKAWKWWLALSLGGPGWILFGAAKLFLGSFLAYLALKSEVPLAFAGDPAHMYQVAFSYVVNTPGLAIMLAAAFVFISQLKINVANAYAGSLAWSNFFSRITHNHPGRVVWMFFNVAIALLLMELGIYQTIEKMLLVYSVLVLAWLSSVMADLVINKPLGLSPKHIEFKRSHLYDINPVGVGSMFIASAVGFTAHFGWYGATVQALASYIAFIIPLFTVPLIAYLTKSKYYLVPAKHSHIKTTSLCHICENEFEHEDMSFCPAYGKAICSLCCSLDVRCGDQCRQHATISAQAQHFFKRFVSTKVIEQFSSPLVQALFVTLVMSFIGAGILFLIYLQIPFGDAALKQVFATTLIKIFFLLLIIIGVVSWLFILARSSNRSALKELRSQATTLANEIAAHTKTAKALQDAKEKAESANNAKSRYISGLSHELRTPLNVLLGYAQLLSQDEAIPENKRESINILRRNGEHLADLIESLLEISKIEAGRVQVQHDQVHLHLLLEQLVEMFQLQASKKGIDFIYDCSPHLPNYVATDKQRFRQIMINLLSNAIKFTQQGRVSLSITYRNQVAQFKVKDSGLGIAKAEQEQIFKPFERVRNANTQSIAGTGLGLTISQSLAELMGGQISLSSALGQGSEFTLKLMLPPLKQKRTPPEYTKARPISYHGPVKTVMVVDDDPNQRQLMRDFLQPLGFNLLLADSAEQGFRHLSAQAVDLLLLDVNMPDTNGWQMAKQLREQQITAPILMISANGRDGENNQQAAKHHNDYISKPINFDALLSKLAQFLALEWSYKMADTIELKTDANLPEANSAHYQSLIALAEIGYLSGFTKQLTEIESHHALPQAVKSQLSEYLTHCNFPKITQYLNEIIEPQAKTSVIDNE